MDYDHISPLVYEMTASALDEEREKLVAIRDEVSAAIKLLEKIEITHKPVDADHVCGPNCPVAIYHAAIKKLKEAIGSDPISRDQGKTQG